jgi:hypothetical protein
MRVSASWRPSPVLVPVISQTRLGPLVDVVMGRSLISYLDTQAKVP